MNETTKQRIEDLVSKNNAVLFMKGTPEAPMCGFSARAVAIMNETGVAYQSFNVLEDPDVREGIKEYGNWPTIPQLYIKSELVGGSDILMEMYQSGELQKLLS